MTLRPVTDRPPVDAAEPPPRRVRPAAIALLVGALPLAVHAWLAVHGYFGQDDFIFTHLAARAGWFDLGYLFQSYHDEHLIPGVFLLAWIVTAIAPLNYSVAVLPLLLAQAVTAVLLWRLLVRCFGSRPALLPLFAVFTFAPLVSLPTLWWAYGMQLVPLLLAMVTALSMHQRYLAGGSPRHAVYAVLATATGLAFHEKAVLIPALLFGLTALLAPSDAGALRWALVRHRSVWVGHAALLAGYAALYLARTSARPDRSDVPVAAVGEFAGRMVVDTFLGGLFGGPWAGSAGGALWAQPPSVLRLLLVGLAAALVVTGLRRQGRKALLAWTLLAGYLAADVVLLAVTRLPLFGPMAGADPRYIADAVPVAVLCAAFAFLPPRTSETAHPGRPWLSPARRLLLTGAALVLACCALVNTVRLAPPVQFAGAREYVANARAALAAEPDMVLYDGRVPSDVLIEWFVDDARVSRVIGLLPGPPRFDQPAERMYLLDDNGRPLLIDRLADPIEAVPGPAPNCGHLVHEQVTVIPLKEVSRGRRVLRLAFYAGQAADGTVNVAGQRIDVRFEAGVHVLNLVVDGAFVRVDVNLRPPASPVCVTDIHIGLPII